MQKTTDCQRSEQIGLFLPERPANDVIHDRLAALVAEANEHLCAPERRVELHAEIVRLRRILEVSR
jgi:hypothetical protein